MYRDISLNLGVVVACFKRGDSMNFIWDIILNAAKQDIAKDELFFWQASQYSPYYEQSFSLINKDKVETGELLVEINSLYRFSHIFQEILHPQFMQNSQYANLIPFIIYMFDTIIHYLSEIDLRHGLTKREFYVRKIRSELKAGVFGKVAQSGILQMNKALQFKMANEVLTQMQTGSNMACFRRAVLAAFPNSFLYQSNFDKSKLFLYIGKAKNEPREKQVKFILENFLPLGFNIRVFWKYHFGIMGVDTTMNKDEIAIF